LIALLPGIGSEEKSTNPVNILASLSKKNSITPINKNEKQTTPTQKTSNQPAKKNVWDDDDFDD
jgi:hypothetical protein